MDKRKIFPIILAVVLLFFLGIPHVKGAAYRANQRELFLNAKECRKFSISYPDYRIDTESAEEIRQLRSVGVAMDMLTESAEYDPLLSLFGEKLSLPEDHGGEESFDLYFIDDSGEEDVAICVVFSRFEDPGDLPVFLYGGEHYLPSFNGTFYAVEDSWWMTKILDEMAYAFEHWTQDPLDPLITMPE